MNRIKRNLIFSNENIKPAFNDDQSEDVSDPTLVSLEQGFVEDKKPMDKQRIKSGTDRPRGIKLRSLPSEIQDSTSTISKPSKVGYSLVGLMAKNKKDLELQNDFRIFTLRSPEKWTDEDNNPIGSYEDVKQKLKDEFLLPVTIIYRKNHRFENNRLSLASSKRGTMLVDESNEKSDENLEVQLIRDQKGPRCID